MGQLNLVLICNKSDDTLNEQYQRSTSSKYATVQSLADLLQSIVGGTQFGGPSARPSVAVSVEANTPAATGTFTLSSVVATNTCSINGVTFTARASGAGANEFNVGADDTATALNLKNAINASVTALVSEFVEATSALNVVTVTAKNGGVQGNSITIVGSANIAANHARLTGGAVDPDAKTYSF